MVLFWGLLTITFILVLLVSNKTTESFVLLDVDELMVKTKNTITNIYDYTS